MVRVGPWLGLGFLSSIFAWLAVEKQMARAADSHGDEKTIECVVQTQRVGDECYQLIEFDISLCRYRLTNDELLPQRTGSQELFYEGPDGWEIKSSPWLNRMVVARRQLTEYTRLLVIYPEAGGRIYVMKRVQMNRCPNRAMVEASDNTAVPRRSKATRVDVSKSLDALVSQAAKGFQQNVHLLLGKVNDCARVVLPE